MKKFAALSAILLMTSAAVAQTATQAAWIEIEDDDLQVPGLNITIGELDDMDLYNAAGEQVGEVDDVLGTEAGVPTAVAVEIDEGLFNDKTVIFQLADLTVADNRLTTRLTADEIAAMPAVDDD